MPPRCQSAPISFRGVTCHRTRARAGVPRTRGRTGRVRRLPSRTSPLPRLDGADRGGSAAPGTHRCEPSHLLRGGALVTNQHSFQRGGWLPRVPAVPVPSARSRVGGRERPRRCPPATASDPTVAAPPVTARHLRRRYCGSRWLVVVIAVAFLVSCARLNICFLSLWRCAILVASYLARSLSQLSSAVCRSTPRGAGCFSRTLTWRHHRGGLPRAKPHPQFWRRRGKTPMVTTPPIILVFIRLTLLRRLPSQKLLGERSNVEHRRRPGRLSGTVTWLSAEDAIPIVPQRGRHELVRSIATTDTAHRPSTA